MKTKTPRAKATEVEVTEMAAAEQLYKISKPGHRQARLLDWPSRSSLRKRAPSRQPCSSRSSTVARSTATRSHQNASVAMCRAACLTKSSRRRPHAKPNGVDATVEHLFGVWSGPPQWVRTVPVPALLPITTSLMRCSYRAEPIVLGDDVLTFASRTESHLAACGHARDTDLSLAVIA